MPGHRPEKWERSTIADAVPKAQPGQALQPRATANAELFDAPFSYKTSELQVRTFLGSVTAKGWAAALIAVPTALILLAIAWRIASG
jgi:hypothetical protein